HPHSHITADVVDGAGVTFHDRPGDVGPSGQLTLAHEVAVGALAFDPGETLTQPLMPAALPMVGDRLEVGATGPIHTELAAHLVDRHLGHLAKRSPFPAGDGQETLDAVPSGVVE